MALLSAADALPGATRVVAEQRAELPQKNDLCGPFWGLIALRAAGIAAGPKGLALDQDAVADAAGTVLSPPPHTAGLPPGEPGRTDYRLVLPTTAGLGVGRHSAPGAAATRTDGGSAGTSAPGLARAIVQLGGGRLAVVPATGPWAPERLRALLVALRASAGLIAVLANLDMSALWEPTLELGRDDRYLRTGRHAGDDSAWRVGHVVALVGARSGPAGTLVTVADTYASRGIDGLHRQPLERVARALAARGLLLVVTAAQADCARRVVLDAGLALELWDNGSADARSGGRGCATCG